MFFFSYYFFLKEKIFFYIIFVCQTFSECEWWGFMLTTFQLLKSAFTTRNQFLALQTRSYTEMHVRCRFWSYLFYKCESCQTWNLSCLRVAVPPVLQITPAALVKLHILAVGVFKCGQASSVASVPEHPTLEYEKVGGT